jgi:hypothetical protein
MPKENIEDFLAWKNSKRITAKLQVFINKCLRKILRIFWPDQIMNKKPWKRTKQPRIDLRTKQPRIDLQIRKHKWEWLGHTLRKPSPGHSQTSPRVKSPRQTGQGETEERVAKNGA